MAAPGGRQQRFSATIWPGFVDALATLLLVLVFALTIFMVVQSVMRQTISSKEHELDELSVQLAGLADALGLERARSAELAEEVEGLGRSLDEARGEAETQAALIATLTATLDTRTGELDAARSRITAFEAQVAALLAERDDALGQVAALGEERAELLDEQEALNLALARARTEIDAQTEAARLAAARREALEALVADLRAEGEATAGRLSETEAARLTEAAAAEALRARLRGAEDELTAMTLALEEQRKRAEETLTLLAAAEAARKDLDQRLAEALLAAETGAERQAMERAEVERRLAEALAARLAAEAAAGRALTAAEERAALLSAAETALAGEKAQTVEAQRRLALLNEQIAALRTQLGALQNLLDASAERDAEAKVQIEALGSQLNSALAQVAAEQRRRAELEEAERIRLQAEAEQLARYRSEFFGKLSEVLAGREGVRVVGDRFVFSSEVLFEPGSAELAPEGRSQIARVAATLAEVADDIPAGIDWIIRVDGHTDAVPLSGAGPFADNWELSQARALSVVRYMQEDLGFPPHRLAATGFGEYRPVAEGDSPEARAANRRIELKLTER